MYTFNKKDLVKNIKGLTLLELTISVIIFGLLLFAMYATLDVGLKGWQLGSTKSDLHQKAEIVLSRIIRELTYSTALSVQIENDGNPESLNQYISFETPMDNNGSLQIDPNTCGAPKWQGYILYYIKPRVGDPSKEKKYIYRNYVPRTDASIYPAIMPAITNHINATTGNNVRTLVKDIYSIDFDRTGNIITVNVCFQSYIRKESSVAFSSNKGTEIIKMSTSIKPKN
ncbi:MAG TPA: prepilin-type N-terminal cleavage/methylation domain-containing protein [Candidatus Eremiobacteraeota bacterium]|nr:MAG: hypothetical protein BWY64_03431 [bacterium ADurb.Bin363]HPZ08750.1 prepilin-type N-terminal cleavage/methylation domain-containing protein [Candidatus Eremiobacteraeota bacterium]